MNYVNTFYGYVSAIVGAAFNTIGVTFFSVGQWLDEFNYSDEWGVLAKEESDPVLNAIGAAKTNLVVPDSVKCSWCGQWATVKTACVHCGQAVG